MIATLQPHGNDRFLLAEGWRNKCKELQGARMPFRRRSIYTLIKTTPLPTSKKNSCIESTPVRHFLFHSTKPINQTRTATMDQAPAKEVTVNQERKCEGADCDKDAGSLQCPTCQKLGKEAYFCGQDCFKRNWVG